MTVDPGFPEVLKQFSGESFQKGYVAPDADHELEGLVYVLDLQEALPSVQRLRDWALAMLGPRPGETAVDVGCGTGAEVRRMAALVGSEGRAVGVEPHPGLRSVAEERTAAEGVTATFVEGDAVALPFADGSVDVVRSERVFQHLPDAEGAIAEMARVLRPGGRVVIIDSDWGSAVTSPGDPEVVRAVDEAAMRRLPNPFAGRLLRSQLAAAGLSVDPDIGSTAVVFPDVLLRDPLIIRHNSDFAVEDGTISRDQADELVDGFARAAARGEAFFAVTMYGVAAHRPQR